jgi:hypothetical protein
MYDERKVTEQVALTLRTKAGRECAAEVIAALVVWYSETDDGPNAYALITPDARTLHDRLYELA